mgnify:CR=1 FL=1|jgi:hypothetical protein
MGGMMVCRAQIWQDGQRTRRPPTWSVSACILDPYAQGSVTTYTLYISRSPKQKVSNELESHRGNIYR